jgi:uncharacterized SAM-binding protein YcdF (DUF218 family)
VTVKKIIVRLASGIFLLLILLAAVAFFFPQNFLTVENGSGTADAIIVLGGGWHERSGRAAELFRKHVAPRIIVSGAGDDEMSRLFLIQAGVPANAIQLESKSRTTRENAQFAVKLLREQKAKSAVIVTSWYHSRRAFACFRHFAPEINFSSHPSHFAFARKDWPHDFDRRVYLEYGKLLGYWIGYGIRPF